MAHSAMGASLCGFYFFKDQNIAFITNKTLGEWIYSQEGLSILPDLSLHCTNFPRVPTCSLILTSWGATRFHAGDWPAETVTQATGTAWTRPAETVSGSIH